jgi:hypothetical protein
MAVVEAHRRASATARCVGWFEWVCRLWTILTGKRTGGDPCVYIPERIINRPDPCIYSQFLLMQLGLPVTWDNPDVTILLGAVEQNTYALQVDTEYDLVVTVHNSSREKAALGTQIAVRWIEFGAGAQIRHHIATLTADVPIWPGVTTVSTKWRTPASPGHYCIEVELAHPDDGNPANNRGWNNTQVLAAASTVRSPIRIFNRWPEGCPPIREGGDAVSLWRVLFGYALLGMGAAPIAAAALAPDLTNPQQLLTPAGGYLGGAAIGLVVELARSRVGDRRSRIHTGRERLPCTLVTTSVDSYAFDDHKGKEADPATMFAGRPPAWPARIEPDTFAFAPNEAYRDVELIVEAPDEPGPPAVFNVNVLQGGVASGGVTVTIQPKEG